jgi:hypothetical protein
VLGARAGFDSTLSAIIHEHGLADRLDRVVLVGFSQGTIMALDALASGRWPMGKIVGFSGRLVAPENARPSLATRSRPRDPRERERGRREGLTSLGRGYGVGPSAWSRPSDHARGRGYRGALVGIRGGILNGRSAYPNISRNVRIITRAPMTTRSSGKS